MSFISAQRFHALTGASSTHTVSLTIPANCGTVLLLAAKGYTSDFFHTVLGATINGVPMTVHGNCPTAVNSLGGALCSLQTPPIGTQSLVVTWSDPLTRYDLTVVYLTDTTALSGGTAGTVSTSGAATVTVPSANGQTVYAIALARGSAADLGIAAGDGETVIWTGANQTAWGANMVTAVLTELADGPSVIVDPVISGTVDIGSLVVGISVAGGGGGAVQRSHGGSLTPTGAIVAIGLAISGLGATLTPSATHTAQVIGGAVQRSHGGSVTPSATHTTRVIGPGVTRISHGGSVTPAGAHVAVVIDTTGTTCEPRWTRLQLVEATRDLLDATGSSRWKDIEVLRALGAVHRQLWGRLLTLSPQYQVETVRLTATGGIFPRSALCLGLNDDRRRCYRIHTICDTAGRPYLEVKPTDVRPFLSGMPTGIGTGDLNRQWWDMGASLRLLPQQTTDIDVTFSWIPVLVHELASNASLVTWPHGYEMVLAYHAAAMLATKGGAELEAATSYRALGLDLLRDLLADVSRRSHAGLELRSDTTTDDGFAA